MAFRVGMTFDAKGDVQLRPEDPPDLIAEFDHEETIGIIEEAIRSGGHEVIRIGNARALLERVGRLDVDMVFNIAEGYEGRNRESQVPVLLEMMRVPFVGSDGLTFGLSLDKMLAKKILMTEGIPTPRCRRIEDLARFWQLDLRYPLIVKLQYEGSSKGMSERSLVDTPAQLRRQVEFLWETYSGARVFVEEFIEGTEFTVPIIGNDPPEAYPVCQITLDGETNLGRKFYTFDYLRDGADYLCPAAIEESLATRMQQLALRTYEVVECRDFGRVDFRVDRGGNPHVLEINPLPSLSTEDVFHYAAKANGMTYNQIVNRILDVALVRNGLKATEEAPSPSATRSR